MRHSPYLRTPGRLLLAAAASVFVLLISSTAAPAAVGQGGYAGWKVCGDCHGAVSAGWQKTRHAGAFADLAKSGQEGLPACVGCHVTGQGRPGGFVDKELTAELAGVQCEACHGPGRQHAASRGGQPIVASPGIETCRQCHTPGQDPGFDYSKKVAGVHSAVAGPALGSGKGSSLTAQPDHFKFGALDEGTPAITTVTIQNTGDRDVTITNVRTS